MTSTRLMIQQFGCFHVDVGDFGFIPAMTGTPLVVLDACVLANLLLSNPPLRPAKLLRLLEP
jgi:pentose-5-phosphate-3-epimerase